MCSAGSGVCALEDVLPLSSRYLMSSTSASVAGSQSKPDVATLAADNHVLRDTVEQQHFKLKVWFSNVVVCLFPAFLHEA